MTFGVFANSKDHDNGRLCHGETPQQQQNLGINPPWTLNSKLKPMPGLRTDKTAQVIIAGHAFTQNLRRGQYELAVDAPPAMPVATAFAELARAI